MRNRALVNVPAVRLAFGSVSGTYANLLASIQGRAVCLVITNSLNSESVLSLDGGTTDWGFIPARVSLVIDLASNETEYNGTVSVKHNGVAPTSGAIAASIIRSQ